MPSSASSTSSHPLPSATLAQVFASDDEDTLQLKYIEQMPFLEFLNVPHDRLPKDDGQVTLDTVVQVANSIAKFMKDLYFPNEDLLVFKSTGSQSHSGHIATIDCRPDFTAAFKSDWGDEGTTLWPCIRLVGGKASEGKSREGQEEQAMTYLYYLLMARPDLYVAQGLFTTENDILFLLGIGGIGIFAYSVGWGSEELHRLMYAFIYRLYDPGDFADLSFVKMVPDLKESFVTYNVQITGANGVDRSPITITNLRPTYAGNPFGTRTHILSNPNPEVRINGEPLTVLKEQLCQVGTWFHEYSILTHVHTPEKVPGVVEAVYHEVIKIPSSCLTREKHRIGLRQVGKDLTSIPTVIQVLEIIFDILEVLQYLRFKRHVLHRDISIGNILYVEDDLPTSIGTWTGGVNEVRQVPEGLPLCFIKYLLGESNDPQKTSALLIDFNHAEDLESKQGHEQIVRTGTPFFIARSVQLGKAVTPYRDIFYMPEMPKSPGRYEACHPDRIKKFPNMPHDFSLIPKNSPDPQWRHELDHDTESVFWVFLYWVVAAQPENEKEEPMKASIWTLLTGSVEDRIGLLHSSLTGATHSVYQPLWPLLKDLAAILDVDRHWAKQSDPRNDPGYVNEAFQRLIFQFILDHCNENFMQYRVGSKPRRLELVSGLLNMSSDLDSSMDEKLIEDSSDSDKSENQFADEVEEMSDEEE